MQVSNNSLRKMDSTFAFISHSVTTFPNQQPKIDNAQLARRKRRRTSPTELSILEQEFQVNSRPDRGRREYIASRVGMTEKAVQIWFQNKRQSFRKKYGYGPTILDGNVDSSSNQVTTTLVDTDVNPDPLYGLPTPPLNSQFSKEFTIFNDNAGGAGASTEAGSTRTKSIRLSMSEEDGKAVLVSLKKSPRKALSENKENAMSLSSKALPIKKLEGATRVLKPMSPSKRRNNNAMSINSLISSTNDSPGKVVPKPSPKASSGKDQREAECISNLLSLRSGVWA